MPIMRVHDTNIRWHPWKNRKRRSRERGEAIGVVGGVGAILAVDSRAPRKPWVIDEDSAVPGRGRDGFPPTDPLSVGSEPHGNRIGDALSVVGAFRHDAVHRHNDRGPETSRGVVLCECAHRLAKPARSREWPTLGGHVNERLANISFGCATACLPLPRSCPGWLVRCAPWLNYRHDLTSCDASLSARCTRPEAS